MVIRKYENRRLYDTENSRYVNLDDIARLVREGVDVQVLDAATGEDLTRLVLTQIIVEDVRSPGSGFPLDTLRQMVVASGRVGQESVVRYMKTMVDMYQNAYRAFAPGLAPFDFMQPGSGSAGNPAAPSPPSAPSPAPRAAEDQDMVAELRRRIDELERIARKSARKHPAKKQKKTARRRS